MINDEHAVEPGIDLWREQSRLDRVTRFNTERQRPHGGRRRGIAYNEIE
jgi:hypothetical protein